MNMMEAMEHAKVLGVNIDADEKTIENAWKKLFAKNHPDRAKNEEDKKKNKEFLHKIDTAKEYLLNLKKNKCENNVFGHLFREREKEKVPPIEVLLELNLEEVYTGVSKTIKYVRKSACKICKCTGTLNQEKLIKCNKCSGRGIQIQKQRMGNGFVSYQTPCDGCRGSGIDPKENKFCDNCHGNKLVDEQVTKNIKVEKGYHDGDQIILENYGHQIIKDKNRGKLVVHIKEKEHDTFKRINNQEYDILYVVKIKFEESLCGFKKNFVHLDKRTCEIIKHDPTTHNEIKIVPNEGLPKKNIPGVNGNLYLCFDVEKPKNITFEQQQQIYKILTGKNIPENYLDYDSELIQLSMFDSSELNIEDSTFDDSEESDVHVQQECSIQ